MKIGISAIGYECEEHLDKVLNPWFDFKSKHNNIYISVTHGVFPETHKLGYPIYSKDNTIQKLHKYENDKKIDYFQILDTPTFEKDLRNSTLQFLFYNKIDLLWLLDLQDEIYTEDQIYNIINYVEKSNKDWFKINFKNYVFEEDIYVDNFIAPRIWKNYTNDGINQFYYDNEIIFNNGKEAQSLEYDIIPKEIAFIKHLSWVGSKEYLNRKINFQKMHYGNCSYSWNDQTNKLEFNMDYYSKINEKPPIIYKDKE
jgi:hypothetical protein